MIYFVTPARAVALQRGTIYARRIDRARACVASPRRSAIRYISRMRSILVHVLVIVDVAKYRFDRCQLALDLSLPFFNYLLLIFSFGIISIVQP